VSGGACRRWRRRAARGGGGGGGRAWAACLPPRQAGPPRSAAVNTKYHRRGMAPAARARAPGRRRRRRSHSSSPVAEVHGRSSEQLQHAGRYSRRSCLRRLLRLASVRDSGAAGQHQEHSFLEARSFACRREGLKMARALYTVTLLALACRTAALLHGVEASCHAEEHLDLDGPALSWCVPLLWPQWVLDAFACLAFARLGLSLSLALSRCSASFAQQQPLSGGLPGARSGAPANSAQIIGASISRQTLRRRAATRASRRKVATAGSGARRRSVGPRTVRHITARR